VLATAIALLVSVMAIPASAASPDDPTNLTQEDASAVAIANGGVTNDTTVTLGADLTDDDDDDVRLQVEVISSDDDFTNAPTDAEAVASAPGTHTLDVGSLAPGTYDWQARSTDDSDDPPSAWVAGYTFRVNAAPDDPADLEQADDLGPIASPNGVTNDTSVELSGSVSDTANETDEVELQVEVITSGGSFTDAPTDVSGLAAQGSASVLVTPGPGTYDWQARTADEYGGLSDWRFGGTFRINAAPDDPTNLDQSDDGGSLASSAVTNDTTLDFSGKVSDPDGVDQLRLEVEIEPAGTAFDGTGTETSGPVADGQVATVSPAALTPGSYHWRARTLDEFDAASGWVYFGEVTIDFRVNAAPNDPANLDQADGGGSMAVGALTNDTSVTLSGDLTDPDNDPTQTDTLQIEVEVQPVGTPFTDSGTTSTSVDDGDTASVTVGSLTPGTSYHWQARTIDEHGAASAWMSFGGNAEPDADFRIPSADLSVTQSLPTSVMASATTPTGPATRTLIYEVTVSNAGPDDAPAAVDLSIDGDRFDVSSARYGTKTGPCGIQTGSLGTGDTFLIASVPASGSVTTCISVNVLGSPTPLINGPLPATNGVGVTSAVHDPAPGNNSDSDGTSVLTVPTPPPGVATAPGNGNAFVRWDPPTSDGGSDIIDFRVTVTGGPSPVTLTVAPDNCGTPGNLYYCVLVPSLSNGTSYSFTVRANNAVGLSGPSTTVSTTPTIDASAKQINNSDLSQKTGNTTNPTATDTIIASQTFPTGTTGVGLLLETGAGASAFCGGAPCIGNKVLINKLEDPTLTGIYVVELLYYKTLVNGTGVKYVAWYQDDDDPAPYALPTCPKVPTSSSVPCSVIKLGKVGANPQLRILIYTDNPDPTVGGRLK
jgi:hypothetical protein